MSKVKGEVQWPKHAVQFDCTHSSLYRASRPCVRDIVWCLTCEDYVTVARVIRVENCQ